MLHVGENNLSPFCRRRSFMLWSLGSRFHPIMKMSMVNIKMHHWKCNGLKIHTEIKIPAWGKHSPERKGSGLSCTSLIPSLRTGWGQPLRQEMAQNLEQGALFFCISGSWWLCFEQNPNHSVHSRAASPFEPCKVSRCPPPTF